MASGEEMCSQNYLRSPKQQKTKIKHKFWAISTLKKSKDKGSKGVTRKVSKLEESRNTFKKEEVVNSFKNMERSVE